MHGTFVFTLVNVTDEEELPFMVTSETIQNTGTAYVTLAQELDYEIRRSYRFMASASNEQVHCITGGNMCRLLQQRQWNRKYVEALPS